MSYAEEVGRAFRVLPQERLKVYDNFDEEDRKNLVSLINCLAVNSLLSFGRLMLNVISILKLKDKIIGIHPLNYLETVFSEELKKSTMVILKYHIPPFNMIRDEFIKGIVFSLVFRQERGELENNIELFSRKMGLSEERVRGFVREGDFSGLISYMMLVVEK